MAWVAEWRTKGDLVDAIFVLDAGGAVHEAFAATQTDVARFLTQMGDLTAWRSDSSLAGGKPEPREWGELVAARSETGEVLEVEPELFWHGIYLWFRSRGVDYDTPGLGKGSVVDQIPKLRLSVLMDD